MTRTRPCVIVDSTISSNETSVPGIDGVNVAKVEEELAVEQNSNDSDDNALQGEQIYDGLLTPKKRQSTEHDEQPDCKRPKQSSKASTSNNTEPNRQPTQTAGVTTETWQGFCEIESEPAFFSAILHDMGVRDIKVQDVFSMQPESLDNLSRPIYGLILLYNYRGYGFSDQSVREGSHVWFANQLPAQNSCATLAMINIFMNSPEIKVGEHLQQFKDFTKEFTPYQRGEAFASFDFVKRIHNSFAKEMDILEADKHLSYKVRKTQRSMNENKSRRKSIDSITTEDSAEGFEDNAHHFIAYVPVKNDIWMLDGLNAQPLKIASFKPEQGEDWVSIAADSILAILASGGDDYTGFAIMPSPLPSLRQEACLALNQIQSIESQLDNVSADWRSFVEDDQSSRVHPQVLGIEDQLSAHPVPDALATTIASESTQDLLARRTRVLEDLNSCATNIILEVQNEDEHAQKAAQGRFDHGPVIKMWAEMLASNGYLEQNLDRFIAPKGGSKKAAK